MHVDDKGGILKAVDRKGPFLSVRIAGPLISGLIGLVGLGGLVQQALSREPDKTNMLIFVCMLVQSAFVLPSFFRLKRTELVLDRQASKLTIVRTGLTNGSRPEKTVYSINQITGVDVTGDDDDRFVTLRQQGGAAVLVSLMGQPDESAQQIATAIRDAARR